MLKVLRSPARVSWLIMFGEVLICTKDTKKEAEEEVTRLRRRYGVG